QVFQDLEESISHPWPLIVAALLFAFGLALSSPTTFALSSVTGFVTINSLFQQFIAGLLVVAAFVIMYAKKLLSLPIAGLFAEAKTVAAGGVLWTIGMVFVGLGNANGFTPLGVVSSLVGYALLLVSLYLGGTLGAAIGRAYAK